MAEFIRISIDAETMKKVADEATAATNISLSSSKSVEWLYAEYLRLKKVIEEKNGGSK